MSEEFPEHSYSAFWPLLIFLAAFVIFDGIQLFEIVSSRNNIVHQIDADQPAVNLPKAQAVVDRFGKLIEDLVNTAKKDPNAAAIVRESIQAGILHVQRPPANSAAAGTNAPPANP